MFFDLLHDTFIGLIFFFVAFVVLDWSRIWWHSRRHGYIKKDGVYVNPPWRWENSYMGYKVWTGFIFLLGFVVGLWHIFTGAWWLIQMVVWAFSL
jgi:hypothetical protein